jgi:adenine-specific DNA methylase
LARTPEGKVKDACVNLLKEHKAYYFFLGIECKAGYNKPTLLQEREIAEIHKAGGAAMVIREDTVNFLEDWLRRTQHG